MPRRFNWQIWSGFALSVAAFFSYFELFIRYPITRDVPWATMILFVIAIVLMVSGLRKAAGRRALAWVGTILGIMVCAFFCVAVFVGTKMLPASPGAPGIGAKAPDFVLLDTSRHPVALTQLLAAPGSKGVILIFYRGYW